MTYPLSFVEKHVHPASVIWNEACFSPGFNGDLAHQSLSVLFRSRSSPRYRNNPRQSVLSRISLSMSLVMNFGISGFAMATGKRGGEFPCRCIVREFSPLPSSPFRIHAFFPLEQNPNLSFFFSSLLARSPFPNQNPPFPEQKRRCEVTFRQSRTPSSRPGARLHSRHGTLATPRPVTGMPARKLAILPGGIPLGSPQRCKPVTGSVTPCRKILLFRNGKIGYPITGMGKIP